MTRLQQSQIAHDYLTKGTIKCLDNLRIWKAYGIGGKPQSTMNPRQYMKTKFTRDIIKLGFGNAVRFILPAYGWSRKIYASSLANCCQMKFGKRKSMDTAQTLGENGYG